MNYKLLESSNPAAPVILKRTRTSETVTGIILFLLAAVMVPTGLLLFIDPKDIHVPFFLTGMGLLFLTGGIMVITQIKIPEFLQFDNANGMFTIKGKKNAPSEEASIPYAEIEGFHVRYHQNDNYGYYVAEMIKKDGAFWAFYASKSKKKADDFLVRLSSRVTIASNPGNAVPAAAPRRISVNTAGAATVISWANRYSFKSYLFLVLIVGSMSMLIYGSRSFAAGEVQFGIAAGFMAILTLFIVLSLFNNIGRTHVIEITSDQFTYRKRGGIIRRGEFSLPLGEIGGILFNFSLSRLEAVIYVLKRDELVMFQEIMRGTISGGELIAALKFITGARKIQVGELSIADKIKLEELLQKIVEEKSGVTGI